MAGAATIAGYAVKAAGSIVSGFGTYYESAERENVLRYNAAVAMDKGRAEKRAIDQQNRVNQEVNRGKLSSLQAEGGVRGIIMSSGSPLLTETKMFADQIADATELGRQGEIARIRGENQSAEFRRHAKSVRKGRWLGVAGSVMAGMS